LILQPRQREERIEQRQSEVMDDNVRA